MAIARLVVTPHFILDCIFTCILFQYADDIIMFMENTVYINFTCILFTACHLYPHAGLTYIGLNINSHISDCHAPRELMDLWGVRIISTMKFLKSILKYIVDAYDCGYEVHIHYCLVTVDHFQGP